MITRTTGVQELVIATNHVVYTTRIVIPSYRRDIDINDDFHSPIQPYQFETF